MGWMTRGVHDVPRSSARPPVITESPLGPGTASRFVADRTDRADRSQADPHTSAGVLRETDHRKIARAPAPIAPPRSSSSSITCLRSDGSQESAFGERREGVGTVADDDVVEDVDIEDPRALDELTRHPDVLTARRGIPARMIVEQDQRRRAVPHGRPENLTRSFVRWQAAPV